MTLQWPRAIENSPGKAGPPAPELIDTTTATLLWAGKAFLSDTGQSKSANLSRHQLDASKSRFAVQCHLLCSVRVRLASCFTFWSQPRPSTLLCAHTIAEGLRRSNIKAASPLCVTQICTLTFASPPAHHWICTRVSPAPCYLSHRVLLLLGTFCLVLGSQLELLLFLFKINQIPLIFQPSLPSLPELQEKRNCSLEMLKYS